MSKLKIYNELESGAPGVPVTHISQIEGADMLSRMVNITYSELLSLRDNNNLIPGSQYRITDFVTTCNDAGSVSGVTTRSAGHAFDIIVIADSTDTLNENARAVIHEGDTYFADSNLTVWQLKYSLDNDTDRFAWAVPDSEGGRGVIYYMKDEFDNECFYDFKNIQYQVKSIKNISGDWTHDKDLSNIGMSQEQFYYTYSYDNNGTIQDLTLIKSKAPLYDSKCKNNKIIEKQNWNYKMTLPCIVGVSYPLDNSIYSDVTNSYGNNIIDNDFGNIPTGIFFAAPFQRNNFVSMARYMIFNPVSIGNFFKDNAQCNYFDKFFISNDISIAFVDNIIGNHFQVNSIGNYFQSNVIGNYFQVNSIGNCFRYNVIGNDCFSNAFGDNCHDNTINEYCENNTFGNNCHENTFGIFCHSNSLGNDCTHNTSGDDFRYNDMGNSNTNNVFGDACHSNSLGNSCHYNTFGNMFNYNKLGNSCYGIAFRKGADLESSLLDNVLWCRFDQGCSYIVLYADTTKNDEIKHLHITAGVKGAEGTNKPIEEIDTPLYINIPKNTEYQVKITTNSVGEIKMYNEADWAGAGDGYTFINTATPSTTPIAITEDSKVFYIATEEGDYSNFGLGNINSYSILKSSGGKWVVDNLNIPFFELESFLPIEGGKMKGDIDMQGYKVNNIGIEEVDKLPTENLYEGRMVRFKNKTYTFYNGLWLALSDDLRGHANDTHEENFVYQPTADDLSIKDGFADIKNLKGNTVVWNQISNPTSWYAGRGATASYDSTTGIHTLTTLESQYNRDLRINKSLAVNHKYLIKCVIKPNHDVNCSIMFYPSISESSFSLTNGIKTHVKIILHAPSTPQDSLRINILNNANVAGITLEIEKIQIHDLTQMFGEGNEPATVEEFEAMFPNDYYEYNEGELISFDGKGLKSVGFNAFDGERAKVLKGQKYYLGGTYIVLGFKENENSEPIAFELPSDRYYTPNSNGYIVASGNDICINLSHSGYRDGDYEPYEDYKISFQDGKTISQLTGKLNGEGESVVIFPDGLRSAGEAFDEIVYDESTGKHKAIKRIGSVDMGTLNWTKGSTTGEHWRFVSVPQNNRPKPKITPTAETKPNCLCVSYNTITPIDSYKGNKGVSINNGNAYYLITDESFTDVALLKQSLAGQILYYELATPEVYELDNPINTSYEAYDFGTEEVLYNEENAVNIPMKADIEYGFNAVDMIRNNFEEIRSLKERVAALEQAILQMQAANTSTEMPIEP